MPPLSRRLPPSSRANHGFDRPHVHAGCRPRSARPRRGTGRARARPASLHRIESLDGGLNAFIEVDADRALAAADQIEPGDERPFAGVPIAIKANVPVEGLCMNFGSRFLQGHRPGHNAYLVRRLRDAGFVIVGVTNMPEFGILPTTEPRHTGPTRNPWDPGRTPGGSSGGSAAAVAAGMVPIAHGNDGGGSIRIPASCTGLVGLKPSRGRVSRGPDLGDSFLASDGVLSHTVGETAHLLDVLAGYEVGDATWAPRPAEPYSTAVRRDPGRLRIAMTAENPLDVDVDPECIHGMRQAADLLASLGHDVEEAGPHMPGRDALGMFIGALRAGRQHGDHVRRAARRPPADRGRDRAALASDPRARAGDHVGRLPGDARAAPGAGAGAGRLLRRL